MATTKKKQLVFTLLYTVDIEATVNLNLEEIMDRSEQCAALARWLEPQPDYVPQVTGNIGISVLLDRASVVAGWQYDFAAKEWKGRDFFTDPAASELLVLKMLGLGFMLEIWPQVMDAHVIAIFRKVIGPQSTEEYGRGLLCANHREAVAFACLALIESEGK